MTPDPWDMTVQIQSQPQNGNALGRRPISTYAMPFGKHKGILLHEVPLDYLRWLVGHKNTYVQPDAALRAEIDAQLEQPTPLSWPPSNGSFMVDSTSSREAKPAPRPFTYFEMPRGTLKGTPLHEVPQHILEWCLMNDPDLDDNFRFEIEDQLGMDRGSSKSGLVEEKRLLKAEIETLKRTIRKLESNEISRSEYDRVQQLWRTEQGNNNALRQEIDRLKRAAAMRVNIASPSANSAKNAELPGILKRWYRNLSLRFHPDRGGSHEQAIVVTEAFQTLRAEIEKWEKS